MVLFAALSTLPLHSQSEKQDADLHKLANKLAHQFIITDTHVDLPYHLKSRNFKLTPSSQGILIKTKEGNFDYERAKKGGLDAPFMSIYVPASYQKTGGAKDYADTLINLVQNIANAFPGKFSVATSPAQIESNFKKGTISLPMGMENGAPVEDDLNNVGYFQKRGIRYITLTHSKDNQICDSSYDTTHTWNGLSEFGKKVVAEMNRVGIMVDISHVSDSTFWQVMDLSKAPCIASHSSCRKFTPGFERNMSDAMIKRLAENGGVIQINFGSSFLDGGVNKRRSEMRDELTKMLKEKGIAYRDEATKPYLQKYIRQHKKELFSDVEMVANHIDHVAQIAGIDHVGIGSDFDGVGDSLPVGLKDVSAYPNLIYALLKRGYSESDIEKICYKNLSRVWNQVDEIAGELQQN